MLASDLGKQALQATPGPARYLLPVMPDNGHIETTVVEQSAAGERLDRLLAASNTTLSRSRLKALILAGAVTVARRIVRDPSHRVQAGDTIAVAIPGPAPATPQPEDIPLAVVYEDDDLIVIDKPKGLVVHPAA